MIVEDEPLAAEVIQDYIEQIPHLELVSTCKDAIFALQSLQQEVIDVIFLDIHLPKLRGLDFIKTLKNPPAIILTTAYHQYALEGFDLDVVDYLLKPIEFTRFLKAINKLDKLKGTDQASSHTLPHHDQNDDNQSAYRFFKVNKKNVKVLLDDILYIESLKEYVRIYTSHQTIITKFQLGEIQAYLNWSNLIRVHRSYLVARDKIDVFDASQIEIKGNFIPIGRSYKELVMKELSS